MHTEFVLHKSVITQVDNTGLGHYFTEKLKLKMEQHQKKRRLQQQQQVPALKSKKSTYFILKT